MSPSNDATNGANSATKRLTTCRSVMRVASYALVVAGLLAFSLVLGQAGHGDAAALPSGPSAWRVAEALLFFVLGIVGLGTSRTAERARLGAALALIGVAVSVFELVAGGASSAAGAGPDGADRALCLVTLASSVAMLGAECLVAGAASRGSEALNKADDPEFLPDSMRQSGAAPFATDNRATGKGEPLALRVVPAGGRASGEVQVLDVHGAVVYRMRRSSAALSTQAVVSDLAGNQVATVRSEKGIGQRFCAVDLSCGPSFQISEAPLRPGESVTLEGLGWRVHAAERRADGFEALDERGRELAHASWDDAASGCRELTLLDRSHADELAIICMLVEPAA